MHLECILKPCTVVWTQLPFLLLHENFLKTFPPLWFPFRIQRKRTAPRYTTSIARFKATAHKLLFASSGVFGRMPINEQRSGHARIKHHFFIDLDGRASSVLNAQCIPHAVGAGRKHRSGVRTCDKFPVARSELWLLPVVRTYSNIGGLLLHLGQHRKEPSLHRLAVSNQS